MVAIVERKSNIPSFILEKDSYVLRVRPGVCTAQTVALDASPVDDTVMGGIKWT